MVIFHAELLNNQMVYQNHETTKCIESALIPHIKKRTCNSCAFCTSFEPYQYSSLTYFKTESDWKRRANPNHQTVDWMTNQQIIGLAIELPIPMLSLTWSYIIFSIIDKLERAKHVKLQASDLTNNLASDLFQMLAPQSMAICEESEGKTTWLTEKWYPKSSYSHETILLNYNS